MSALPAGRTSSASEVAQARRLLISLYFLTGIAVASWLARLPSIRSALDLSAAELGSVLVVGSVGSLAMVVVAGAVTTTMASEPTGAAHRGRAVLDRQRPRRPCPRGRQRRGARRRDPGLQLLLRPLERPDEPRDRGHRAADGAHRRAAVPCRVLHRQRHRFADRRSRVLGRRAG